MNAVKHSLTLSALVITSMLTACALFSPETSIAPSHPEALPQGRPICADCHEGQILKGALKPYAAYNHTATFVKEHRFAAARDGQLCAVCHAVSFCNDCHAAKTEIKPSTKLGDRPDRELIHRGDFLTRHRIEGKIDPSGCYACHGRANNEKCVSCHR
jgi:hypothetical protein